jgi:hypothetical protein
MGHARMVGGLMARGADIAGVTKVWAWLCDACVPLQALQPHSLARGVP